MSNNLDSDRSVTTNKMYPIDLAPQKITIVKSVPNADVKMSHLVTGQPKTTGPSQIIAHTGPLGLMRPSPQIISSSVSSQPHMIVSSSPMMAGTQIVSQGSQGIGQNTQIISQSQLIGPGGQLVGPGTQIISQGTQLNANSGAGNTGGNLVSVSTSGPVLNVGGQLVSGTGNLVVSSSVRTLPPSVRVLPPMQHHNTRPAVLSNVSLNNTSIGSGANVMVSKTGSSHVPRGLAAGASLAVPRVATRPVAPVSQTLPISSLGTAWSSASRGVRGAVVYSARAPRAPLAVTPVMQRAPAPAPLGAPVSSPAPAHTPLSTIVTVPPTSVLSSTGVITAGVRSAPRVPAPASAPRPMPLVQRNYQPPAKLLGVPNVGVRPVGNSAPSQLYYEVSRPAPPQSPQRPLTPFHQLPVNNQVNVLNVRVSPETRPPPTSLPVVPRPSILRKRDVEGSPTKNAGVGPPHGYPEDATAWEPRAPSPAEHLPAAPDNDAGGGSTTESAASSPAPDDDPPSPPAPPPRAEPEISPRKKPRKQALSSEVRQCEFAPEEKRVTPPPAVVKPPPKRPQLSSSYVCGWRATALHFSRPSDVRRREARPRDILAIANQKHVLAAAEGWKVHHLTAQMDDLVSLEADVSEQLGSVLRTLEAAHGKAQAILAPHSHALLELVKGNIQRSRIVCEGVQEAREDILRVFTHRTFVSDILSRQADKRCFRKHRSQS